MAATPDDPAHQLEQRRRLHAISNFIAGAATMDELLPGAQSRILEHFQVERTTLFALDTKNRHFFSLAKTGGEFKEIRVALDPSSIAGFVGLAKRSVNLAGAAAGDRRGDDHPAAGRDPQGDDGADRSQAGARGGQPVRPGRSGRAGPGPRIGPAQR